MVHFLIGGALLFGVVSLYNARHEDQVVAPVRPKIVITEGRLLQLRSDFQHETGLAPTKAEVRALLHQEIDAEIMLREGLGPASEPESKQALAKKLRALRKRYDVRILRADGREEPL